MADLCVLVFERRSTYVDRAVRYLVELDGVSLAPRLGGDATIKQTVQPGDRIIRVSAGRQRFFEAHLVIGAGEVRRFQLVHGLLFSWDRQPRLVDLRTGQRVPGAVRKRARRLDEPVPRHLPSTD